MGGNPMNEWVERNGQERSVKGMWRRDKNDVRRK